MATTGYDRCNACHDQKIAKQTDDGLVWFALPMLDTDALEDEGIEVGPWPEVASGDFEGEVPFILRAALIANNDLADELKILGDDFDFMNIDPDDPDHLQAAGKLALAIKGLLRDLASEENLARHQFAAALSGGNSDSHDLVGQIPRYVFETAMTEWFGSDVADSEAEEEETAKPNTSDDEGLLDDDFDDDEGLLDDDEDETENDDDDELLGLEDWPLPPTDVTRVSFDQPIVPDNGWYRDDGTCQIGYRPRHHADALMKSLLSVLSESASQTSQQLLAVHGGVNSSGQCMTCHQSTPHDHTTPGITWSKKELVSPRGFTKFSHAPHLIQPKLSDCTHCHELDSQKTQVPLDTVNSNETFTSDFHAISKTNCTSCHNPKGAGAGCVKCHHYHVHSQNETVFQTKIDRRSSGSYR